MSDPTNPYQSSDAAPPRRDGEKYVPAIALSGIGLILLVLYVYYPGVLPDPGPVMDRITGFPGLLFCLLGLITLVRLLRSGWKGPESAHLILYHLNSGWLLTLFLLAAGFLVTVTAIAREAKAEIIGRGISWLIYTCLWSALVNGLLLFSIHARRTSSLHRPAHVLALAMCGALIASIYGAMVGLFGLEARHFLVAPALEPTAFMFVFATWLLFVLFSIRRHGIRGPRLWFAGAAWTLFMSVITFDVQTIEFILNIPNNFRETEYMRTGMSSMHGNLLLGILFAAMNAAIGALLLRHDAYAKK